MSPLPTMMRDRWQNRPEPAHGHGTVYWHMLFKDQPQVQATARKAQRVLADFGGFHMTPPEWLHMTTLIAGSTDELSSDQMKAMLATAQQLLSKVQPIKVQLGRVLYHPEAIMLGAEPADALAPVLRAAKEGTRVATGKEGQMNGSLPQWTPHMTISYSTSQQPAAPIIETLGKEVPPCDVTISALSLVIQWGPEREWDWEPVGTARLGTP
ncbi:2'-5' RNA ligase family protein [Actinomadura montaniterrae]|uniref:2'-5' RNA ligase family protein n=1 Tax=Actinomadura montaniterrae TaxID=1803903 RepID=A0A6L3VPU1_9ACTN|nr:2'-5' RNA ligase family protein [Actinomadura montaniterrae]KAB2371134.1 2'-5' RNA ligase family protein [Actinomadura montaniterrae]